MKKIVTILAMLMVMISTALAAPIATGTDTGSMQGADLGDITTDENKEPQQTTVDQNTDADTPGQQPDEPSQVPTDEQQPGDIVDEQQKQPEQIDIDNEQKGDLPNEQQKQPEIVYVGGEQTPQIDTTQDKIPQQTDNMNEATPNDVQQTGVDEPDYDADVYVKQWYPKGTHYVFVCETPGMRPTHYTWHITDNTHWYDVSNGDIYHIFTRTGTYDITCIATDGKNTVEDTLTVHVEMAKPNIQQDNNQKEAQPANVAKAPAATLNKVQADLNQDGNINEADKKEVLDNFGVCQDCKQDIDKNGVVDVKDLSAVLVAQQNSPLQDAKADVNKDGYIDESDMQIVGGYHGQVNKQSLFSIASDINNDGAVDYMDEALIMNAWHPRN